MAIVVNDRERIGEEKLGVLFDGGKVRRRREWRGLRDTLYDYGRWLYILSILAGVIAKPRNVKAMFRYRWFANYLAVPHMLDKFTMGLRDEPLRIVHTAMDFVVKDVAMTIDNSIRGDRRTGNDVEFSDRCVLSDENAMTAFMMSFPTLKTILREIPTMFSANLLNQYSTTHYLDVAQQFGIPGDVCPMPEAEAGISIDDDFPVLGKCAVQVNTTCDGSLMGNGIIAKRLEREYGIPTFQLVAPMRHREEDVQKYAAQDMKNAIAFVEEKMGVKWDWKAYFECAKRVNQTTRDRTHGGYKVLVDELWELCEKMNADMVMMWEHMSCKALTGMHGQFEEQARERGLHLVWVCHDLCDPRVYTRQAIRDQFNVYMRTVMREEPLDPSIEVLPDENA